MASRRHKDIYWTHNDSGNRPVIYAIRRDGSLIAEFPLGVPNRDWEDTAADETGHLYVSSERIDRAMTFVKACYDQNEQTRSSPSSSSSRSSCFRGRAIRQSSGCPWT